MAIVLADLTHVGVPAGTGAARPWQAEGRSGHASGTYGPMPGPGRRTTLESGSSSGKGVTHHVHVLRTPGPRGQQVEGADGLVADDEVRLHDQRPRDGGAPALAFTPPMPGRT
ncbi:hypothetical protein OK074_0192 [Actinobacteria bacterium OK074]|nr:hypothetical protein OK074_0192 [Actinobacteria bacterium OK074]